MTVGEWCSQRLAALSEDERIESGERSGVMAVLGFLTAAAVRIGSLHLRRVGQEEVAVGAGFRSDKTARKYLKRLQTLGYLVMSRGHIALTEPVTDTVSALGGDPNGNDYRFTGNTEEPETEPVTDTVSALGGDPNGNGYRFSDSETESAETVNNVQKGTSFTVSQTDIYSPNLPYPNQQVTRVKTALLELAQQGLRLGRPTAEKVVAAPEVYLERWVRMARERQVDLAACLDVVEATMEDMELAFADTDKQAKYSGSRFIDTFESFMRQVIADRKKAAKGGGARRGGGYHGGAGIPLAGGAPMKSEPHIRAEDV